MVDIVNLQNHYVIQKSRVKKAVREALGGKKKDARLSIAFVDDKEIKNLNRRYFGSDDATDVISFPLSSHGRSLSGEIVVSVETAVDTAGRGCMNIEGEIILYVVHGILHLLGYSDRNEEDAGIMHEEESRILRNLGYNVPKVEDGFL